jgi:hypothetical protein
MGGDVRSAQLTIGIAQALFLTLRLGEVLGGTANLGIFTLTGPTLTSPLQIALSSTNPQALVVPTAVTLLPGQRVLTFPVATAPVDRHASVDIIASWGIATSTSVRTAVLAPEILTVPIRPAVVTGGATAMGSLTFSGPIPASGITVNLASSHSSLATVPDIVTVLPGSESVTFPVATSVVSRTQVVTIAAGRGTQTRYGTLVVAGPLVASVALSPDSVTGGAPSQGTVTLTTPAPPGGIVVVLTSGNAAAATVPVSVMVPAGATSAAFDIVSQSVATPMTVTISAGYDGMAQSAVLTVLPARGDEGQ